MPPSYRGAWRGVYRAPRSISLSTSQILSAILPRMTLYITTPIYYVNDAPHIGHAYTTVIADVLTRYQRLYGEDTFFLTGTDEHGQKVEAAAKARGVEPQAHCDELVLRFKECWRELNISNDFFIRTTDAFHKEVVQGALQKLFDSGEIYKKDYEGWYSVSEEIFYTEKDLVDGKSPEGKEVQKVTETNYFFRMSHYQERLIEYVQQNPDFVRPAGKKSEVLGFLKQPLNDLCISRPKSRLSWGIELPFDTDFVTYVWFDALLNYVSAIGYGQGAEQEKHFHTWWPHAVHLIGKDILMTHAIYWPCMLMALEIPLPKTIFAHGWWLTADAKKMSKSDGSGVDPFSMRDEIGIDGLRYYFVRDTELGNDAYYSPESIKNRLNSELANKLGNLFSRTVNLICTYHGGVIPESDFAEPDFSEVSPLYNGIRDGVWEKLKDFSLQGATDLLVELLNATNRYLDTTQPWKVAKSDPGLTAPVLSNALHVVCEVSRLFSPVMPEKTLEILRALGEEGGVLPEGEVSLTGRSVVKPAPIFPRV